MSDRSILIIDDEPDIGRVFGRVAIKAGLKATVTSNAEDFKNGLQDQPDFIMIDLQMPGTDGVELIRYLADQKISSQIIIASGFDSRVIEVAKNLGIEQGLNVAATLNKPVSADELFNVLNQNLSNNVLSRTSLLEGLEKGEFKLFLQPKQSLDNGEIIGFECLLRWIRPDNLAVSPADFIASFESEELYSALSHYVTDQACEIVKQLQFPQYPPFKLSVNISAADLIDLSLSDRLKDICAKHEVAPQQIVLEITESVAMADPVAAMDNLARLRLAGFGLSLDDFGTGYSSLSVLRKLPFNEIKIDQTFVKNIEDSPEDQAIVQAVVGLGKAFKMKVVAEGCENESSIEIVKKFGCDIVQGYGIGRPMKREDVGEFLAKVYGA